jgi:predicted transcriptional regulator
MDETTEHPKEFVEKMCDALLARVFARISDGGAGKKDIERQLELDRDTVNKAVATLRELGKIEPRGYGRACTYYTVSA